MPLEKSEEPPTRRPALSRSSYSSFLFPRGLSSASSYRLATVVFLVATISFLGAGYHQQDRIQDYLSPPAHEHEGILQPPITRLTDEEARLRAYEWKKPEPDESLLRQVANLSEDQQRVRNWLRDTRPEWDRGVGIGLARADPPEPIRTAAPVARPRSGFPNANQGPGRFKGGDSRKYMDLVREWQLGRKEPSCDPAPWQSDYREFHAKTLSEELAPRFLQAECTPAMGNNCGGLADRMLSIGTTFLFSILTKRAFSIRWEHPFPPDLIFDSVNIDWSFPLRPEDAGSPRRVFDNNQSKIWSTAQIASAAGANAPGLFDLYYDKFLPEWQKAHPSLVRHPANRGLILTSFTQEKTRDELFAMGLKEETAWACMLDYLIRPKYPVLQYIAEYSSYFALPSVYSIGIQIRVGDWAMLNKDFDNSLSLDSYKNVFQCADEIVQAYARPGQKPVWYIVSDSTHLQRAAAAKWPDKVVITNFESKHVDGSYTDPNFKAGEALSADSTMESIATQWIMSHTDFNIITPHSGFGRIPTWRRAKQGRVIELDKNNDKTFCNFDRTVALFSELASTWSLG